MHSRKRASRRYASTRLRRSSVFRWDRLPWADLSGIDVAWHIGKARPDIAGGRTNIVDRLVEMKRLGQKTMAGYFKYDKSVGKGREPICDPEIEALFAEEAKKAGIAPRDGFRRRDLAASHVRADQSRRVPARKKAWRCVRATSISSTSTATVFRRIAAARCGMPMKSACKAVYDKVVEFGWEPAPLLKKTCRRERQVCHCVPERVEGRRRTHQCVRR